MATAEMLRYEFTEYMDKENMSYTVVHVGLESDGRKTYVIVDFVEAGDEAGYVRFSSGR